MKILVIGDSCIDVFRYGEVARMAPEAPVPIIIPISETSNPGMAGNVVENIKALGAEVDFLTNGTPIRKIRYICSKYNYILLRVDENDKCERIEDLKSIKYSEYDAIIISDYCKGFLTDEDIKYISQKHPTVFLDTKKILGDYAHDVLFIKINYHEFERNRGVLSKDKILNEKVIVTRGKFGCNYQGKNYPTKDVPVKDVSGAGDTFLAGLVVRYAETSNIISSIKFAQKCTTVVVQKPGVATI